MRALAIIILFLPACGSSTDLTGRTDASADPPVDTPVDAVPDARPDPAPDPVADPVYDCPEPQPSPDGPMVSFTLDGTVYTGRMDFEEDCSIYTFEIVDETTWIIELLCLDPSTGLTVRHVVEIFAWPPVWMPISMGEGVSLRYVSYGGMYAQRWLALSYPEGGGLVLGAADADTPAPPSRDEFYWPLSVWSTDEDWCPVIDEGCYRSERVAVIVGIDDYGLVISDSTVGYVGEIGAYGTYVDTAVDYSDIDCDDVPDGWYTTLHFMAGWD